MSTRAEKWVYPEGGFPESHRNVPILLKNRYGNHYWTKAFHVNKGELPVDDMDSFDEPIEGEFAPEGWYEFIDDEGCRHVRDEVLAWFDLNIPA